MQIAFLFTILFLPSHLCEQLYYTHDYPYIFNSSFHDQNEINSNIIGAYGDYPDIAPEQSKSQIENFANSVNIFQTIEKVFDSLPIIGSGRRSGTVSGNAVYDDLVKSGEVVRIILVFTSQVKSFSYNTFQTYVFKAYFYHRWMVLDLPFVEST